MRQRGFRAPVAAAVLLVLLAVLVVVMIDTTVLAHFDESLADRLRSFAYRPDAGGSRAWLRVGTGIGELGDGTTVVPLATLVALAAALITRRRRPVWASALTLLVLVAAVEGGKHLIGRKSPGNYGTDSTVFRVGGASFPSGHSSGTLVVFGLIATLVAGPAGIRPSRVAHRLLTAAALLVSASVGTCTVVLGWHWPTDVVGGWLLGGALLLLGNRLLGGDPHDGTTTARGRGSERDADRRADADRVAISG